jgi:hypothetical protein
LSNEANLEFVEEIFERTIAIRVRVITMELSIHFTHKVCRHLKSKADRAAVSQTGGSKTRIKGLRGVG